jgi:peptidoglycan/xylan/chitin deacetylase (PgdA/CDA1 family)
MGSVRMPKGKRMACALCFDFDALSLWLGLFRFTTANPLSRGEFGATVAIPRILDILDRHRVRATFFVPGHTAQVFPDAVRAIFDRGHEIAAHSMYHAPYEVGLAMSGKDPATPAEQRGYLEQQIAALEKVTRERPVGFRSPIGDWVGDHIPQFLIDLGFTYDSSLQGHDFVPYRLRLGDSYQTEEPFAVRFGKESKLLEIPLHWDTNDFAQFEFLGYYLNSENPWFSPSPFGTPSQVFENFTGSFNYCHENVYGGVWNTILHPQCCGRDMKAAWLDKLIGYVTEHDDVWFTTMREVTAAYDDNLVDARPAVLATAG